jgi:hypothetical protein
MDKRIVGESLEVDNVLEFLIQILYLALKDEDFSRSELEKNLGIAPITNKDDNYKSWLNYFS